MWPIWEWFMGIAGVAPGCAGVGIAPCCEWSIGMVMPGSMVEGCGGVWPVCAADFRLAVTFFLVAFFFAAAFFAADFFVVVFAGICMPGMCICCAAAGATGSASARALGASC